MNKQMMSSIMVLVSLLVIVGCNAQGSPQAQIHTETSQPITTMAPSQTPPLLPLTATRTLSPTAYIPRCIRLEEVEQIEDSGVFALRSRSDDALILIRSDGLKLSTFMDTKNYTVTSPDRTKIAFIPGSPHELVIATTDGSILGRYLIPEDWAVVRSWVSDNRLFIVRDRDKESRINLDSLIVFDPETGRHEEMKPDFPDIAPWVEGYPKWFSNLIFLPDPTLEYVLYELKGGGISLWHIDSQMEIMRLYDEYPSASAPVWNHDGEWFIVSVPVAFQENGVWFTNQESELPNLGGKDLFLVTKNGEIHRLTYFSTQYYAEQRSWSLSPDEIKLAFWVDTDFGVGDPAWQLAVVDISTKKLSVYCVSAGNIEFPITPTWSPDGSELMVTKVNSPDFGDTSVSIIGLDTYEIFTFPDSLVGRGWLTHDGNSDANEP